MDARAHFPLTCHYLGASAPPAVAPTEFVEKVCAAHAKGDIPSRAVRDLVNYEAALLDTRAAPAAAGPLPRDDERCILAPHIHILVFGAALPEMLLALREGKPAKPRPMRGWLVFWKGGELLLYREEGWLLETFRKPTPPEDAIEDDEDRALFARFWQLGLLRRA